MINSKNGLPTQFYHKERMKKPRATIEQVRELEKSLANIHLMLAGSDPRTFFWRKLKEREREVAEKLGDAAKKIQIQLHE